MNDAINIELEKGILMEKFATLGMFNLAPGQLDPRLKPVANTMLFASVATNCLQPLLVKFMHLGGISLSNLAVVNSLNSLERAIFTIPLYQAGHDYGRRRTVLVTHFITFISFLILSISFEFPTIITASILLGFVANTPRAIGRLLLSDLSNPTNFKLSFDKMTSMSVVGVIIGVLAAGVCSTIYDYRMAMMVQMSIAAVAFVHALAFMPETVSEPSSSEHLDFKEALRLPIVWALVLSSGVTLVAQGILYQGLAVLCHSHCPQYLESSTYALILSGALALPYIFARPVALAGLWYGDATVIAGCSVGTMCLCMVFGGASSGPVLVMAMLGCCILNFASNASVNSYLSMTAPTEGAAVCSIYLPMLVADLARMAGIGLVQWGAHTWSPPATFQVLAFVLLLVTVWAVMAAGAASKRLLASLPPPARRSQRSSEGMQGKEAAALQLQQMHRHRWPTLGVTFGLYMVMASTLGQHSVVRPALVINDPSQLAGIHSQGTAEEGRAGGEVGGGDPEGEAVHFDDDPHFRSIYTGPELVGEMETYKKLRDTCQWHVESFKTWNRKRIVKGSGLCYVHSDDRAEHTFKKGEERAYGSGDSGNSFNLIVNPECPGQMSDYHVHLCEVTGEHPGNGGNYTWVIYRFGQFTGTGSAEEYDWHQLAMRNFAALGKRMVNGSVWATGAVFAPVDSETGDFVGYPPIRNHHTYMTYLSQATPLLWAGHADSQCQRDDGGTACLIEVFPPGYAMQLTGGVQLVSDLNYVGGADEVSRTFQMEAAIRLAPERPPALVTRMLSPLGYPGDMTSGSLALPLPSEGAVIWGQTFWPDSGTLRAGFLHVHAKRFEEIWVFAASAEQLGLNKDPLVNPSVDPKDMFIPREHNMTNQDVKDRVMAAFAQASNRSVEEVRPLCIGKQVEEQVDQLVYDRHTSLDCLPYTFGRGHLFTQIAFYSAEEGPTGDPEIRMKANNSDDEYYTTSEHKVFQMHSSPVYLMQWAHPERFPASVTLFNFKDGVCYDCMKSVDFVQQYCNRDLAHMQYCVNTFGVGNFQRMAKKLASYFGLA